MTRFRLAAPSLALAALVACRSTTVASEERGVRDEAEALAWAPATAADLAGHWRVRSIEGPAAAVLLDVSYWIDPAGRFSGAALFAGPPPTYQVLSGAWSMAEGGALVLGEESEPARAEVAGRWLRLSGTEGSLVFERAEIR